MTDCFETAGVCTAVGDQRKAIPLSASDSQRCIEVVSYYDLEDHGESTSATIDYYLPLGALSGEQNFVTLGKQTTD